MSDDSTLSVKFSADVNDFNRQARAAADNVRSATSTMRADAPATADALKKITEQLAALNEEAKKSADNTATLRSYANWSAGIALVTAAITALAKANAAASAPLNALNDLMESRAKRTREDAVLAAQAVGSLGGPIAQGIADWRKYAESQVYAASALPFLVQENNSFIATLGKLSQGFRLYQEQLKFVYSDLPFQAEAALQAAGKLETFAAAMAAQGLTAQDALRGWTEQLMHIPGLAADAAAQMENTFASIPDFDARKNKALADVTVQWAGKGDDSAQRAQEAAADMVAQLQAGKDIHEVIETRLKKELDLLNAQLVPAQKEYEFAQQFDRFGEPADRRRLEAAEKLKNAVEAQIDAVRKNLAEIGRIAPEFSEAEKEAEKIVTALNPLSLQLDALTTKAEKLAQGMKDAAGAGPGGGLSRNLKEATGDVNTLVSAFEGFTATAKKDTDGVFRMGYGSDTKTSPNGSYTRVHEGDTTTEEAAARDRSRRLAEIQADAANSVGAAWQKLSDNAKASLTSMAYNYAQSWGAFEKKVPDAAAAAQTGDNGAVARMIGAHKMDGPFRPDGTPMNQSRRETEQANITNPDSIGAAAGKRDLSARASVEAAKELADRTQDVNDKLAGGNAVAQARAAILERAASGQKDEVRDAREMVEAWSKDLGNAQSRTRQVELQNGLSQATTTLAEKELAASQSKITLAGAGLVTEQRKLELAQESYALAHKDAGGDSAKENAALAALASARAAYEASVRAMTQETLEHEERIGLAKLATETSRLREDANHHAVSEQEKLDAELQLAAQETALRVATATKERDLTLAGSLERQRADDRITEIVAKGEQDRQKIMTQNAKAMVAGYQQIFGAIASSADSSIIGMINRTTTLRQALNAQAQAILSTFVSMATKKAAAWAVSQAAELTVSRTVDAAKTASAAGGAASSIVAQKAAEAASLPIDMQRVFGGVAAFLAPILGPAAIPAASAAAATVAAYDIGAWDIPHDQLAVVHKNEMVMPAAESGALRSMLSNAAKGGGAGAEQAAGGDSHVHLNVSATDAGSVKSLLNNHSRTLAKALNQAVRDGNHLGLRRLGG